MDSKLIILDRDGVINFDSPHYIKSPEEWIAIPGSLEAIAKLNQFQHKVVIATNQSGLGRGYYNLETLEKIHQKMQDQLKALGGHLDGIYFCPHLPSDGCDCRKPKPGMLLKIAEDFKWDIKKAIFIGDSERDLEAAEAAQCMGIYIDPEEIGLSGYSVPVFKNLESAIARLSIV